MSEGRSFVPNVLSIAGSDPSGGAGIQADLKTFAAFGCYGMAAITALTAQNTLGVAAIHLPAAEFVRQQIASVFDDIEVAAVKIGMLGSAAIVEAVADVLVGFDKPVVLDPVLIATSGAVLGDDTVVAAMRSLLFPRATVITPNRPEAARLADLASFDDEEAVFDAGRRLRSGWPCGWLIKGGHGSGDTAADLLLDAEGEALFSSPRLPTRNTHGTGCTLSAAITANLAKGRPLRESVGKAKEYMDRALAGADRLSVGRGPGPINHFAQRLLPSSS